MNTIEFDLDNYVEIGKIDFMKNSAVLFTSKADWQNFEVENLIWEDGWRAIEEKGVLLSPSITTVPFTTLIPSWNIIDLKDGRIYIYIRVKVGDDWSSWYSFGSWSENKKRHGCSGQADLFGSMHTDTLLLNQPSDTFQYRMVFSGKESVLRLFHVTTHLPIKDQENFTVVSEKKINSDLLFIKPISQMEIKDGANWCSPVCLAMVLSYFDISIAVEDIVLKVFDSIWSGTGNWPFNTAFIGTLGLQGYIRYLDNLNEAEKFIKEKVPLILSIKWSKGELAGAPLESSFGHLVVLCGFDEAGNPIVNDPAASSTEKVKRTYNRSEFEKCWLNHSGGIAYIIRKN